MSMVTPNAQPRNGHGRNWGNYSAPEFLPNAILFVSPSVTLAPLEAGDEATVDGRGTWSCTSVGTPGLGDAVWTCQAGKSQGFKSENPADYYRDPIAGNAPGADDFVVVVACTTFADRDPGGVQIVAQNVNGFTGWRIAWSFDALVFEIFDGTATPISTGPGVTNYNQFLSKGHLHALALRAQSVSGVLSVDGWIGPARFAAPASRTSSMSPAVGGQLSMGADAVFSSAFNGGIFGMGYYEGTVTDDELRETLGDTIMQGGVPVKTAIPFTLLYDGWSLAQGAPSGAVWTPSVGTGTLDRQGTPAGCRAFFPAL